MPRGCPRVLSITAGGVPLPRLGIPSGDGKQGDVPPAPRLGLSALPAGAGAEGLGTPEPAGRGAGRRAAGSSSATGRTAGLGWSRQGRPAGEVGWLGPHFQAGCYGWVLPAGVLGAAAAPVWPLTLLAESFNNSTRNNP